MSINIKKYTKDQMAKMVEEAQSAQKEAEDTAATYFEGAKKLREQISKMETQERELRAKNAALTESIDQMNGEAIDKVNEIADLKAGADALRNKLADTKAALGRANAELGAAEGALGEMIELRAKLSDAEEKKEKMNATLADCRVTLAQEVEKRKDWEQRSVWQFNHPWRNLWAWFKRKAARHE
jgi:chromosome segregation ATPase